MGQPRSMGRPGPLGVPPPFSGLRAFTDSIPLARNTFPSSPHRLGAPTALCTLCHTLHSGKPLIGGTQRAEMVPSGFPWTHGGRCAAWHTVGQQAMSAQWVSVEQRAGRYISASW